MHIEREFIERRTLARRAAINSGIVALTDRRDRDRRADSFAICHWIDKFERVRNGI